MKEKEYIDLGLPSGTLWKSENEEDYYTYDEAVAKFGNDLPTKEQWEELVNECLWEWDYEKEGYIVTGTNGNSIFLFAEGFRNCLEEIYEVGINGYYYSSTTCDSNDVFFFYFQLNKRYICFCHRYSERSVRLVKNK